MNITDNRTIVMTLAELQQLYDQIATVTGIRRHGGSNYGGILVNPIADKPWSLPSPVWADSTTDGKHTRIVAQGAGLTI